MKDNKFFRKAVSVVMMLSLLLPIASCGQQPKKSTKMISEDDPWFNTNIIEVDTGVEAGRNTIWPNSYYAGSDENYYIIFSSGKYEVPNDELEGLSWAEQEDKYGYRLVSVVDRKTNKTINIIDVKKDFTDINIESHVDNVYYSEGKITVNTNFKERDYDPLTGKLLETRDRRETTEDFSSSFYMIGEYDVELIMYQSQNMREHADINVKTPDGKTYTTEIKEEYKDVYVYAVLELNDTKVLLPATINDYENVYYELDLSTNELIKADPKEYAWMEEVAFSWCKPGFDGMVYYPTQHGISRINAETKTLEEVFSYDWCGLNKGLVVAPSFDLIECSENHFVLCGIYDSSNIYSGKKADKIHLIELDRADKNPNAGKTVLELFDPDDGWVDVNTGKAISVFNETNSKYFIEVTDRYNRGDYFDYSSGDENNEDTWELARINGRAEFSNQLAVDIMNNEGPDILMNVSGYGQLNNSNYLADLTPYVKNDIDKYYENIIEGSKTNGAIYQLPISFALEGVLTKTENVGSSGKGFTFEEYEKFVDEVANGSDPIFLGQATYFSKLFGSMNDKFIVNGKVDLSGPEFAQMADFVKDNVREEGTSWNAQYTERTPGAEYTEYCYGIGGYFTLGMSIAPWGNGVTLAGIPSIDGRGPRFKPVCSVAISAQADNVDACGEFVKILLAEDVQTDIAMNDCFVINREAFRKAGDAAIDYYNNGGSAFSGGNGGSSGGLGKQFSIEDVDFVEGIILSCSRSCSDDASISIILIEEMPAYFLGQKDLDAVVKIAQDRIQKVLDERG